MQLNGEKNYKKLVATIVFAIKLVLLDRYYEDPAKVSVYN